ncbi:hypothetical protein QE152_g9245 [Popillia japonica]|uniref:Uncharacterized protein n=1 Tax=Popillia japonica TaxID=7064 RepID=A0AAW1LZ86_POPJA
MAQDNDLLLVFAIEEHERRLANNICRKQLRDRRDPFNMPGENFSAIYRFSPENFSIYRKQLRDRRDPFNMPGENFRAIYRFSPENFSWSLHQ